MEGQKHRWEISLQEENIVRKGKNGDKETK